jgi:hypothetical protein
MQKLIYIILDLPFPQTGYFLHEGVELYYRLDGALSAAGFQNALFVLLGHTVLRSSARSLCVKPDHYRHSSPGLFESLGTGVGFETCAQQTCSVGHETDERMSPWS